MELNKQDEKLLQELLKKYKQGIVSGLYPGTNITFTPTGCRDKIISSTGGGSSTLFPNGYNFITGDYTLQASDEGKLIISLSETPVNITVPTGSDVFTNKIIGIAMISPGDFEIEPGVAVTPLHQTNDGLGIGDLKCETVICQTFAADGINGLSVLSTSVINDDGFYKTMLRYLYDKSGGGGTPAGSDTQIQYNNAGAFGASSDLIWDNVNKLFIAGDFGGSANHTYIGVDDTSSVVVASGLKNTIPTYITTPAFSGSGLNDLTTSGTFTGLTTISYTITVAGTGTPDTFDWSDTNGGSGTSVSMSTSPILLSNGVEIVFGSDTGHTVSDTWGFDAVPEETMFGQMLFLDGSSQSYRLGDVEDKSDKAKLEIKGGSKPEYNNYFNDNGNFKIVGSLNSQEYLTIEGNSGSSSAEFKLDDHFSIFDTFGNQYLSLDKTNSVYKIGNLYGTSGSETKLEMNDSTGITFFSSPNQFGAYVADGGFYINGGTSDSRTYFQGKIASSGFKTAFDLDYKNNLYRIGDIDSANNSTLISVNDSIGDITLQSNGTVRIGSITGGNGTKITIDDVNEHITISNLPAFDDDAAAGTAGLTTGMVYMTTGSGAAPLNAAGILMIKQ